MNRITVNLSEQSNSTIERIIGLTGESKTDLVNRALSLYEIALFAQANGGALFLREHANAELEKVRFL